MGDTSLPIIQAVSYVSGSWLPLNLPLFPTTPFAQEFYTRRA